MHDQPRTGPAAWVAALSKWAGAISGFLIVAMAVTILVDVGGRQFFNRPLPGGVELNRTFLVAVVFFGLALTQLRDGHIRVDILLMRLTSRWRQALDRLALVLGVATFALIAYMTVPSALRAYRIGEYEIGIVNFPMWPARFLLTIGLGLFVLQLFADMVSSFMRRRADVPRQERQFYE